jgi:hypothetical protein
MKGLGIDGFVGLIFHKVDKVQHELHLTCCSGNSAHDSQSLLGSQQLRELTPPLSE